MSPWQKWNFGTETKFQTVKRTAYEALNFVSVPNFHFCHGPLGDHKGHAVHPIGVTPLTQRADLELINSSHREPTHGYLFGTGQRDDCPGAETMTQHFSRRHRHQTITNGAQRARLRFGGNTDR